MVAPIELIIFDCDGVLIDSEHIACRIEAQALIDLGCPITIEDAIERFTGRPDAEVNAEIEAEYGIHVSDEHQYRTSQAVRNGFRAELKAMSGMKDAIGQISVPRCVASSSAIERLEYTLSLTGLYEMLQPHIFSAQMVKRGKPAPDVFLYAAAQMGISPADCLVIEDSRAGVQAAKAAGMRVWGFTGGSHCGPDHAQRLKAEGAEFIFRNMAELPSLIKVDVPA